MYGSDEFESGTENPMILKAIAPKSKIQSEICVLLSLLPFFLFLFAIDTKPEKYGGSYIFLNVNIFCIF